MKYCRYKGTLCEFATENGYCTFTACIRESDGMSRKIKDIPISPLLEKTALKPCPFCGGEAHIFQIQENSKLQSRLWVVRCPICGANQLPFSEKHYVVEAWNRRVTE